ncbi:MAG: hypothetical protein R3B92_02340 [Patescibacteria group bacterium]
MENKNDTKILIGTIVASVAVFATLYVIVVNGEEAPTSKSMQTPISATTNPKEQTTNKQVAGVQNTNTEVTKEDKAKAQETFSNLTKSQESKDVTEQNNTKSVEEEKKDVIESTQKTQATGEELQEETKKQVMGAKSEKTPETPNTVAKVEDTSSQPKVGNINTSNTDTKEKGDFLAGQDSKQSTVPNTGSEEITKGLVLSLSFIAFAAYMYTTQAKRTLAKFEKRTRR